jgi:chromosome segregation ATPase
MWSALKLDSIAESVARIKNDIETQLDAAVHETRGGAAPEVDVGDGEVAASSGDDKDDGYLSPPAAGKAAEEKVDLNMNVDVDKEEHEDSLLVPEEVDAIDHCDDESAGTEAEGEQDIENCEGTRAVSPPKSISPPPSPQHSEEGNGDDKAVAFTTAIDQEQEAHGPMVSGTAVNSPLHSVQGTVGDNTYDDANIGDIDIDDLRKALSETKAALVERESQLESALQSINEERRRGRQTLADREKQLQIAFTIALNEEKQKSRLAGASGGEETVKHLRAEIAEKEGIIRAYQEEGQALAMKQSSMELAVRKARGELRGVTEERDKAASDVSSLLTQVQELEYQLSGSKDELKAQARQAATLAAEKQSATAKAAAAERELLRLQNDASATSELRQQLAAANAARIVAENALSEVGSRVEASLLEHESWNGREAALQASLLDAERRAGEMEDQLRAELAVMRRRWNDAVARSESIAADAHQSAAPLLAQARALQDEMRHRQEAYAATEAALTERASLAEAAVRKSDASRLEAEKRASALGADLRAAQSEIESLSRELEVVREKVVQSELQIANLTENMVTLEAEAEVAKASARKANSEARKQEALKVADAIQMADRAEENLRQQGLQLEAAKQKVRKLEQDLRASQVEKASGVSALSHRRNSSDRGGFRLSTEAEADDSSLGGDVLDLRKMGSFAGVEALQASLRQKEGEVRGLRNMIDELEKLRDALTDEVAELGRRTVDLEGQVREMPGIRAKLCDLEKKNELLLEMLGEREEEVEALQADLADAKAVFQSQIQSLFPSSANTSNNQSSDVTPTSS